jgi:hypothetical protein
MGRPASRFAVALTVVLGAVLVACGPSKPTGSDYLGKWEGTIEALTGSDGPCHLDISKVGESFVIKSERQTIGNCVFYEGIAILTPEGNLRRGNGLGEMVVSFDKNKNQAVVSGSGKLRYLTKASMVSEQQQNPISKEQPPVSATHSTEQSSNAFIGTWQYASEAADTGKNDPASYLRIGKTKNGRFQLFEGWSTKDWKQGAIVWGQDGHNLSFANGKLTTKFRSYNFRATHANVFEYSLAVESIDDNHLLYTVKSDLGNETHKARRIP